MTASASASPSSGNGAATPAAPAGEVQPARPRREAKPEPTANAERVWSELAATGATLLDKLGQLFRGGAAPAGGGQREPRSLPLTVVRDEATGEPRLQLPMPKPETVQKLFQVVAELLQG